MDSTSATRRPPRPLPALTPASFRSSSSPAAAPRKLEQLQRREPRHHHSNGASRSRALPLRTTSTCSIAHVFFNRRPLDLIRRTTSSVLTQLDESAHHSARTAAVSALSAVSDDDRPLRPLCRLHSSEQTDRRRREPLQHTDNKRNTDERRLFLQQRLQLTGVENDAPVEQEMLSPCAKVAAEQRKLSAMCPPTGKELLRDTEKAVELTLHERVEIQQYDEVYFVATRAVKRARCHGRIQNLMPVHGDDRAVVAEDEPSEDLSPLCHDGYDDQDGEYLVVIGDHLAFRYEVQSALGHGAFGQVVRCVDRRTCKQVAVKIIRNRPAHRDQALMEVQVLAQLEIAAAAACDEEQHVVRMKDHFHFRGHVCLVFGVLGMDLYRYLSLRSFRGLSMNSVRTVGEQLAHALTFLRQQKVVHCDLKPENILLDASVKANDALSVDTVDHVTLIDFGSSCLAGAPMATYIQSRFYRSPEVLLGHACSDAIDMWSLACILVELLTGHPIFAGENDREQFACIVEVLDVPPVDMVLQAERRLTFFEQVSTPVVDVEAAEYVLKPFANSRGRRRLPGSRSLASVVMTDDSDFLGFLARCFVWDPRERLTAEQALEEPWMQR
ncbi:unnamed protein product [Hyaloperonospora brassicae]|uniref:Protein kinase domain-containing protein n=1 Tax=Hyaloperonospora brassicae TaxID=162125 RepID=A0AAV0ULN7_HYABA|nr:unnamed protein product [Hyaloperonospora brassicae]